MTDKELLELAAKAVGAMVEFTNDRPVSFIDGDVTYPAWNPLDDDGDALCLAVKLNLLIDCSSCCAMALPDRSWWGGGEDEHAGVAHDECDPYAATRRAIVRAAAEIGRTQQ